MAGVVGAPLRLAQQRLPLLARQAVAVPVGARVFAAVVEEADVVVLLLERLDLRLDEAVEFVQVGGESWRKVEIQAALPEIYRSFFRHRGRYANRPVNENGPSAARSGL